LKAEGVDAEHSFIWLPTRGELFQSTELEITGVFLARWIGTLKTSVSFAEELQLHKNKKPPAAKNGELAANQ
jgi:hypothetical protein